MRATSILLFCVLTVTAVLSGATFTASGNGSDGPLKAQATFMPGAGSVSVTISDLLANPTSIGQAISDLSFTISGATGAGTYNAATTSATQTTIDTSNGTYSTPTPATGITATNAFHWELTNSGTTFTLNDLSGGKPYDLIIGPPDSNNKYSNANSSISQHNPSLFESATFGINIPGVTANSTVSNVVFSFGTGPETFLSGVPSGPGPSAVPEPSAVFLLAAVVGLVLFERHRRQRSRAA
jgi:hypothetical protein